MAAQAATDLASRVLAGPVVSKVTDNSAEIYWISDNESPGTVRYGVTQSAMTGTASADLKRVGPSGDDHRVHVANLQGLEPDRIYHFEISSLDGRIHRSGSFQTEPAGFQKNDRLWITQGPVLEFLDSTGAVIAWSTNTPASTLVRYGTDPNALTKTTTAPWGQETHRAFLQNLKPGTRYYFVVESGQAKTNGTMAKSNKSEFTTVNQGEAALKIAEK